MTPLSLVKLSGEATASFVTFVALPSSDQSELLWSCRVGVGCADV